MMIIEFENNVENLYKRIVIQIGSILNVIFIREKCIDYFVIVVAQVRRIRHLELAVHY